MQLSSYLASKSFQSFRKSHTKSIIRLSIIATSLSLAVMIISQSISTGFQKEIANKVFGFWGHIHITDIQASRSLEPVMIHATDNLIDSIKNLRLPNDKNLPISRVQSFIFYPTIVATKNEFEGLFLKGVGKNFDWKFFSSFLTKGRIINNLDSIKRDIIISEQTSARLKIDTGQSIILNFMINEQPIKRKLKVVGIYNTGLSEYDKKFALVDLAMLQNLLNVQPDEVTGLELFCEDVLQAETINDYIMEEILPSNWYSDTIRSRFPNIFEWLSLQSVSKNFILLLILAVCVINMSTTTMILIFERTRMIGVLTVLGMKKWNQQRIFLFYASRILIKSIIFGNLFGYGLCLIQYQFKFIKLQESDYYISYAPVDLSLWPVLLLNLLFFGLILFFLLLPTMIVQSIQPVKALKFQ